MNAEAGTHDACIAIIGMAGRFPASPDLDSLWAHLRAARECIRPASDKPADASEDTDGGRYVPVVAEIEDKDCFDAAYFGISPSTARLMDPQHRLFLQACSHALEHAGYGRAAGRGSVGVFAGASRNGYATRVAAAVARGEASMMEGALASAADFLCTLVAYHLDLRGPAMSVQTACSTSLVAVHQAVQALLAGECDMALAGGVSVAGHFADGYRHEPDSILSPDGHCRPFDAQAGGTVPGEGVGVVVLKPWARAVADGDTVHAVIRGSAVSNDGARKGTFTAPSAEGQAQTIAEALAVSGVAPRDISYVEAHGTATLLGDPIELQGLKRAFDDDAAGDICMIGSIKGNLGHVDAAAGIAGLLKVVLALRHRELPATMHFNRANPLLDLESSRFRVVAELQPWTVEPGAPRIAGVSSFGLGGTNAHVVVQEHAPATSARGADEVDEGDDGVHLYMISARTPAALAAAVRDFERFAAACPARDRGAAAATYFFGKDAHAWRRAVACRGARPAQAMGALAVPPRPAAATPPPVVFLFPGSGVQYPGMGRALYESHSVFRAAFDRCADLLRIQAGWDLRELLFSTRPDSADRLAEPVHAQPAIFTIQYAAVQLLAHWGVRPAALLGHSLGEIVAATVADALSLQDAMRLVALRGQLLTAGPRGDVVVVEAGESETAALLVEQTWIAGTNALESTTVAGTPSALDAFVDRVDAAGLAHHRLDFRFPAHTPLLEPVAARLRDMLGSIRVGSPRVPVISNLTGDWARGDDRTADWTSDYWARHLWQPVRFMAGARTVARMTDALFLEIGPGQALGRFVQEHLAGGDAGARIIPALPNARADTCPRVAMHVALGRLWEAGVDIDGQALHGRHAHRRVPTPTYPFEQVRHWIADLSSPDSAPTPERDAARAPAQAVPQAAASHDLAAGRVATVARELIGSPMRAATDARQRFLVDLWEELLSLSGVGISDDFFSLGGNSLIAARVLVRVRKAWDVRISLADFVAQPTIEALARRLASAGARHACADQRERESTITAWGRRAKRVSRTQAAHWSLMPPAQRIFQRRRFVISRIMSLVPTAVPEQVAQAVVQAVTLAGIFAYRLERLSNGEVFAMPFDHAEAALDCPVLRERDMGAQAYRQQLTDVAEFAPDAYGIPLLRTAIAVPEQGPARWVFVTHHILADEATIDTLVRNVERIHRGEAPWGSRRDLDFYDYAEWTQREFDTARQAAAQQHWSSRITASPRLKSAAPICARPPTFTGEAHVARRFAPVDTGRRRTFPVTGCLPSLQLLAMLGATLTAKLGWRDFVVGTLRSERELIDEPHLAGYFVNAVFYALPDTRGEPDPLAGVARSLQGQWVSDADHFWLPAAAKLAHLPAPDDAGYVRKNQLDFYYQDHRRGAATSTAGTTDLFEPPANAQGAASAINDLVVNVSVMDEGVNLELIGYRHFIDDETLQALADALQAQVSERFDPLQLNRHGE